MIYFHEGESLPSETQPSLPVEILKFQDYPSKNVPVPLSNSRIVIRRSVFEEIGGYGNGGVKAFPPDDFNLVLKLGTLGPCIVVQKPYTVAYREHQTNTLRNVKAVADGILGLARFENQGRYPGGSEQRWDRYAVIGGLASNWAWRHCWRRGHRVLAFRLLLGTAPMVAAAIWKKFSSRFRSPAAVIVLTEPKLSPISQIEHRIESIRYRP